MEVLRSLWGILSGPRTLQGAAIIAVIEAMKYIVLLWMAVGKK